jgi:hypothetical protein
MNRVRNVLWKIDAFFAGMFALGTLLTALFPPWIEAFGLEPDGGSGSAEWGIVAVLGVVALTAGLLSRRHFVARTRRLAAENGTLP